MSVRRQLSRSHDFSPEESEGADEAEERPLLAATSTREKRCREREMRTESQEMTEQEMLALAMRLSHQEALRLQQEEDEAVMAAVTQSMLGQTQSRPPLGTAEGSVLDAEGRKRKRRKSSPLLEMPDLSQTQRIFSQDLQPDSLGQLDSAQASIHTAHSPHPETPLGTPRTHSKLGVFLPRLTQEVLDSCVASGFVLHSQTQNLQVPLPKSLTVPGSPARLQDWAHNETHTFPQTPDLLETDPGENQGAKSPVFGRSSQFDYRSSPVFGRESQAQTPPWDSKAQIPLSEMGQKVATNGEASSSQESSSFLQYSQSGRPRSPTFPFSPGTSRTTKPSQSPTFPKSPVVSDKYQEEDGGVELQPGCSVRPVYGSRTIQHQRTIGGGGGGCVAPVAMEDGDQKPRRPSRGLEKANKPQDESGGTSVNGSPTAGEGNDVEEDLMLDRSKLTSDMTLRCSDGEERTVEVSPSPVFPEERFHRWEDHQAAPASPGNPRPNHSPKRRRCNPSGGSWATQAPSTSSQQTHGLDGSSGLQDRHDLQGPRSEGPTGPPAVHYYWGVPFCPRGLDPDAYTQVIVAQMEVLEKSLKGAQRALLRKAEWGGGITPRPQEEPGDSAEAPPTRRRNLRTRKKRVAEEEEEEEEEEEKNRDEEEEEEEEEGEEKRREEEGGAEEEEGGEEQLDVGDCDVCPETPPSGEELNACTAARESRAVSGGPSLHQSQSVPPSQLVEEEEMKMETEAEGGEVEQCSPDRGRDEKEEVERGQSLDAEQMMDRVLQLEEEERMDRMQTEVERMDRMQMEVERTDRMQTEVERTDRMQTEVECPLCLKRFGATRIEEHAAFCNGDEDLTEARQQHRGRGAPQTSLKPRQRRGRKADAAAEEQNGSQASEQKEKTEKCFLCQSSVPLSDYSRHTEGCLQRRGNPAQHHGNRGVLKGDLLSALDQTESRHSEAGSSTSTSVPPGEVIDLCFEEDSPPRGGPEPPPFQVSDSPIRAFRTISQASDSLVDFRQQGAPRGRGRVCHAGKRRHRR